MNEPLRLLLAAVMGAVIGLERESQNDPNDQRSTIGIRTFALISLLGGVAGIFFQKNINPMFIAVCAIVGGLILLYYFLGSFFTKNWGITTEVAIVYSFLLGFLLETGIIDFKLIVAIFVVVLLILSMKSQTNKFILGVSKNELNAFISYAIVALVVFPFLPNSSVHLGDIPYLSPLLGGYGVDLSRFINVELFNPQKIWLIVVLVTGIDIFGYLLGKIFGQKKSFAITSLVAGFISSTSTTQSLAQRSQKTGLVNVLVGAALLANLASFFQIFLLVAPINSQWLVSITPALIILIIVTLFLSTWFLYRDGRGGSEVNDIPRDNDQKIFSLKPALRFAVILLLVKLITRVSLVLFGQAGFMVSSVIASFAGIDAIVLNLADMAGKIIDFRMALITLLLVNAANLLSKSVYAFIQGNRKFAIKFSIAAMLAAAVSFGGLLLK